MPLRIRKYDGKFGVSYRLSIIRNFRDPKKLYPRNQDHEVLAYLGTFRDADLKNNPLQKMKLIQTVDRAAERLFLRKKISERDVNRVKEKARARFELPQAQQNPSVVLDETRRRLMEKYPLLSKGTH